MKKTVRDVMHPGLITCSRSVNLSELALILIENNVHALFVEDEQGSIIGVISDIDLLTGEWLFTDAENLKTLRSITAGEIMSTPVSSVEISDSIETVAARMIAEQVHRFLVREAGKPVGVISVSDIVRELGRVKVTQRTVREVMSRAIVVCRQETPLPAVARGMSERFSRSVVVIDDRGKPLGVITGLDLLRVVDDPRFEEIIASEIMHAPVTIVPDATLRQAADAMITHHIHRLVVIDPQQPEAMPLGIISTSDILFEMASPGSAWQMKNNTGR